MHREVGWGIVDRKNTSAGNLPSTAVSIISAIALTTDPHIQVAVQPIRSGASSGVFDNNVTLDGGQVEPSTSLPDAAKLTGMTGNGSGYRILVSTYTSTTPSV
ncbi:MAG: hypothetical protein ACREN8_00985 [Candidatus Dormibacteraceae bacterium]